jgi:hypothetical protein
MYWGCSCSAVWDFQQLFRNLEPPKATVWGGSVWRASVWQMSDLVYTYFHRLSSTSHPNRCLQNEHRFIAFKRICTSMAGCTQPEDFKCPKISKIETVVHPSGKAKAAFLARRLTVVPEASRTEVETCARKMGLSKHDKQLQLWLASIAGPNTA